jgi:D-hexose-6-phosphate mutarotase
MQKKYNIEDVLTGRINQLTKQHCVKPVLWNGMNNTSMTMAT